MLLTVPFTQPTGGARRVGQGDIVALLMGYPTGLHILERAGPRRGADRRPRARIAGPGRSFRRVMRRLPELHIVAYDRRGYQGSREPGVVGLAGHIADLVDILTEAAPGGHPPSPRSATASAGTS